VIALLTYFACLFYLIIDVGHPSGGQAYMAGSIPSNATCSFLLQAGDELNGQCSDGNTVPTGDDVGDPDEQHELTDE
jgi:hypothetical protein